VFVVETIFKNGGSATVTQRVFRHFDIGRNGKVPTHQTILNWVTQFRTTASNVNKKPSGRPRIVRTPENERRVSHAFQRSPQLSARCHSVALHLSPTKRFHSKRSNSTDQWCMITEGFKPLYPAMCVSLRHLHRCQHDTKFKSSNWFCPTLETIVFKITFRQKTLDVLSDQRCIMTEGFKPLYPAMCVSLRYLHICRHDAKFKSSNDFCPILYVRLRCLVFYK
jgi:hypothetical protein